MLLVAMKKGTFAENPQLKPPNEFAWLFWLALFSLMH